MPSNTQQADRRVSELNERISKLTNGATMAASFLSDNGELRGILEHLSEIFRTDPPDAVKMAIQYGRAKEALRNFEGAVKAVAELAELRRQRDGLAPLTTEAAHRALSEDEATIRT